MKATVVAHPIQGLIKYHGLKDVKRRLPFHDSISVCIDALHTTTTAEVSSSLEEDLVTINGERAVGMDLKRVGLVLDKLRSIVDYEGYFKIVSKNSVVTGKGLGFSASGFAALGMAACGALKADLDYVTLSELVRLGAGSATRSLAGGFAVWYANRDGRSYAEQLADGDSVALSMVIIPVPSNIKTDEAHSEALTSPLFSARLKHVADSVNLMKRAIIGRDVALIGKLAEEDSLNLHASTMTGRAHMVLWEPRTVQIIREVQKMRSEGLPAWFSMDTGPSVFVNTYTENVDDVAERLSMAGFSEAITSKVGDKPKFSEEHLF